MSLQKVQNYFKQYHMEDRIIVLEDSSATVEEAASVLHTRKARIAKTMSFLVDDQVNLIVMAGDVKIDNHKYKEVFHKKCKMVPYDQVEEKTGHQVGGVCPFALSDDIHVYLDDSLKRFSTVFPAAGNSHSAIELTLDELAAYGHNTKWIDVTKAIS